MKEYHLHCEVFEKRQINVVRVSEPLKLDGVIDNENIINIRRLE